jgi:hypothetical protein
MHVGEQERDHGSPPVCAGQAMEPLSLLLLLLSVSLLLLLLFCCLTDPRLLRPWLCGC